ncbi:hypothetical protein AYO47_03690 [Planctomyces sp. SCGC AG-212-M04]|nr:hypothetical protein AYO47_03690 [Planctomyces sp. SCGC AG-212-M04]
MKRAVAAAIVFILIVAGLRLAWHRATPPAKSHRPLVILEGNSEVDGSENDLGAQIVSDLSGSPDTREIATSGETVDQYIEQVATEIRPLVSRRNGTVVVAAFDATNSYGLGGQSGGEVYKKYCEWADRVRAEYPKARLVVSTTSFRRFQGKGQFPADPPDINNRVREGNELLLKNAQQKFDEVVDTATYLGDDPAAFSRDLIHLHDPEKVAGVARMMKEAINRQLEADGAGK